MGLDIFYFFSRKSALQCSSRDPSLVLLTKKTQCSFFYFIYLSWKLTSYVLKSLLIHFIRTKKDNSYWYIWIFTEEKKIQSVLWLPCWKNPRNRYKNIYIYICIIIHIVSNICELNLYRQYKMKSFCNLKND